MAENRNHWTRGCKWVSVVANSTLAKVEVLRDSPSTCIGFEWTVEVLHDLVSRMLDSTDEFSAPEFGEHVLQVTFDARGVPFAVEFDLANGNDEETSMRVTLSETAAGSDAPAVPESLTESTKTEHHNIDPQRQARADGAVTFEEYATAIDSYRVCVEKAGIEIVDLTLNRETMIYEWAVKGPAAKSLAADEACYPEHLSTIDETWQLIRERLAAGDDPLRNRLIRCHHEAGMQYDESWHNGELSIHLLEAGIHTIDCAR